MFAHIPAGILADRFGRRPILKSAWMIGVLATGIMAIATSLPVFIAGMWLYGLTLFVLAPLNSYVTAARGQLSVGRAITLVSAGFNAGAIFGPVFGGWLGESYGYRPIFALAALTFIISTGLIFLIRPQPLDTASPEETQNGKLLKPTYLFFLSVVFIANFAMFLSQTFTPNYLDNVRQVGLLQIGSFYTVAGIGIVLFNIVLGGSSASRGFLIGQAAMAIHVILLFFGSGASAFYPAFFLMGGFKSARTLAIAQVRNLVPANKMGLAYGITETVGSAAILTAPILAGWLYARSPGLVFLVAAGLIVFSIVVSALFFYYRNHLGEPELQSVAG